MPSRFPLLPLAGALLMLLAGSVSGRAREVESGRALRVGALPDELTLDGVLDEAAWAEADAIENLTMVDPDEGAAPSFATEVRVLANAEELVFGIRCHDPCPDEIVSYTVARDAGLRSEDHVRLVLGTWQDGRTGYVFVVNPSGARYDALVASRGEGENSSWDGVWEAATTIDETGWSVELRLPIRSLSFREGVDSWDFNVERRVQRLLETDRWAGARLDWKVTQTSRAGRLTGLPAFDLGTGIAIRPALVFSEQWEDGDSSPDYDLEPSVDVNWKPTPDLTVQFTANTDFAETEVDTRRTNLSRFPLFFPEKRQFFLEGNDSFDFGLGLGHGLVPYHSRRIGLVDGEEVPLLFGVKSFGRMGRTNVGALLTQTGHEDGAGPSTAMGAVRLRQDVFEESTVGMIGTVGDPLSHAGSWTMGVDFTYQTSRFNGDKNFLAGAWALAMDREDVAGDSRSAVGFKIDYPNDLWDLAVSYQRVGEDFDPSLGFVRRRGIHEYIAKAEYSPRPEWSAVRQMQYELVATYTTDLDHRMESYRVFGSPWNWEFESGEDLEFNFMLSGDRPEEDFEISDGVEVPAGKHEWARGGVQFETAEKRRVSGELSFWTGDFYDGTMDFYEASLKWNPIPLVTLELDAERNDGELPGGDFTEDVLGARLRFNFSPDLTFASYVQYDNESDSVGTNNRFRWTITPVSDLFVVFNTNWDAYHGHWHPESHDTAVKIQYEFRL